MIRRKQRCRCSSFCCPDVSSNNSSDLKSLTRHLGYKVHRRTSACRTTGETSPYSSPQHLQGIVLARMACHKVIPTFSSHGGCSFHRPSDRHHESLFELRIIVTKVLRCFPSQELPRRLGRLNHLDLCKVWVVPAEPVSAGRRLVCLCDARENGFEFVIPRMNGGLVKRVDNRAFKMRHHF